MKKKKLLKHRSNIAAFGLKLLRKRQADDFPLVDVTQVKRIVTTEHFSDFRRIEMVKIIVDGSCNTGELFRRLTRVFLEMPRQFPTVLISLQLIDHFPQLFRVS